MKKYLAALFVLVMCSSFISFRVTTEGDSKWILRIYPRAEDAATYLLREYIQLSPPEEQTNVATPKKYSERYVINEALFIDAVRRRSTYCNVRVGDTDLMQTQHFEGGAEEVQKSAGIFSNTTLYLNENMWLRVRYYSGGLVDECRLVHRKRSGPDEVMKWDKENLTCWIGNEQYTAVYDTDRIIKADEEEMRIKVTDTYKRTGLWKKYDRSGAVTDSMSYDR